MTAAERWFIVADDVTGALDSAVGFAGTGLVEYGMRLPVGVDVAAVSTGSRARPEHAWALGERLDGARTDRLYVKVDSTLRGWPVEHVRAALEWWRTGATAVICPAAPALGRTVVGGRVLVHGVPAALTDAGRDPVAPTGIDDLRELFGAPVVSVGELPEVVGRLPAVIVDASEDSDLDALAAALDEAGPLGVPVGSSGLAAALGARRRSRPVRRRAVAQVLVVATSAHPVALAQIAAAGDDLPIIAPPALEDGSVVPHDAAVAIARHTAGRAVPRILADPGVAVVVIGGDGTDAVLSALGAHGVEVLGSLMPGVPWGRIRGGPADGTLIATKSGGFGTTDALNQIHRMLQEDAS